jgi:hypothetical protein
MNEDMIYQAYREAGERPPQKILTVPSPAIMATVGYHIAVLDSHVINGVRAQEPIFLWGVRSQMERLLNDGEHPHPTLVEINHDMRHAVWNGIALDRIGASFGVDQEEHTRRAIGYAQIILGRYLSREEWDTSYREHHNHICSWDLWGFRVPGNAEEGWYFPGLRFCLYSPPPSDISYDGEYRPHSLDGPAIRWDDGTGLYYIHGWRYDLETYQMLISRSENHASA